MLTQVRTAAIRKKGNTRGASSQMTRRHQAIMSRISKGAMGTEPLLSIASVKAIRLRTYQIQRRLFAEEFAKLRYQSNVRRRKTMATTFFRDAIQATDSTFCGCRAKMMVARKAPGMCRRWRRSHRSRQEMVWRRRLVMW